MSSSQGIYLLDTNVFIEAAKHYYAFDLVGSFWKELVSKAEEEEEEGCIESIDQAAGHDTEHLFPPFVAFFGAYGVLPPCAVCTRTCYWHALCNGRYWKRMICLQQTISGCIAAASDSARARTVMHWQAGSESKSKVTASGRPSHGMPCDGI